MRHLLTLSSVLQCHIITDGNYLVINNELTIFLQLFFRGNAGVKRLCWSEEEQVEI